MQENHLFEYAIIRVVPKAEREEFLNAGVILYCRDLQFLETMISLNKERLLGFSASIDIIQLQEYLDAFEKIARGDAAGGAIGKLDPASRFRWLTATRSTVLQTSKVHPGLCTDPHETLSRLHRQMVLCQEN